MGRQAQPSRTFAATRLAPPATPGDLIARERLFRLVDEGVRSGTTLVVGPAGSGKTVLVSSWATRSPGSVAWLSLSAADTTPHRLWAGVAEALRVAYDSVEVPGPPRGGDEGSYVTELADAFLEVPEPVVLVLDDFHELPTNVASELQPLLDHAPDGLKLVLLTRRDPPLRIARLRLAGRLREIRVDDLACTREETEALLTGAGIRLPEATVTRVWKRTEGWMAAVRLVAVSLREADEPDALIEHLYGEDVALSDYLVSEVLTHQPPDVQQFLLETSIVDVLDGSLADALTGGSDGRARLEALARSGVLVSPVDRRGRWFRYHSLFGELLQARLRFGAPTKVDELHSRAAAWYWREGDETRAVRHAAAGGDWDLAATLAAERWVDLLVRGELDALAPLLGSVPEERIASDPALAVALAAVRLEIDGAERIDPLLEVARTALERARPSNGSTKSVATGLALVELMLASHTGEREHAIDAAAGVLEREGESPRVGPALRSLALMYLGTAVGWTGRVTDARDYIQRALVAARQASSPWLTCQALAYLAHAEANAGDVVSGLRRAEQALELAKEHGWTRTSPAGTAAMIAALIATLQCRFDEASRLVALADRVSWHPHDRPVRTCLALPRLVLLASEGRVEDALDVVRQALAELEDWPVDRAILLALHAWQARLLAACGDRQDAIAILDAASEPGALLVHSTRARFLVDDRRYEDARRLLAPLLPATTTVPMLPSVPVDLWLVDALALDGLMEHEAASRSLEQALELAAPGRLLRPIVSHGQVLLPLLRRQSRFGTAHADLIAEACALIEGGGAPARATVSALAEPLSARERQILGYMPTVMSNGDIAKELYLSVNTVKTHVRSIYRKLGVDNRRAAVARAKELRLLGRA
jgi:LuxR family maltose regulon positive regulatory protein